jgi:CheY-like chemotaxis protein
VAETDLRSRIPAVPGGGVRLLIVEDNVDTAYTLKALMQLAGYDVRVVHDGESAVHAAREWQPQAVLCDIGLPGMNGFDVAKALRRHPEMRRARLIAVTGYGTYADRTRALEAGFDDHVTKPADADTLVLKLQSG